VITLFVLVGISPVAFGKDTGVIEVKISKIRNMKGVINIGLYQTDRGWPGDRNKAFKKKIVKIQKDGKATIVFENVPFGDYSFAAYHDEDLNNKLEKSWIGKPQEGICTSRNAEKKDLPPKWKKSIFKFNSPKASQSATMTYLD